MLPKVWDKSIEEKAIEIWQKEKPKYPEGKKTIIIDTPPPYPAPFWHIGAALSYSLQDIIARIFRMLGYNVIYPMGYDKNGIPVEWYVEKYEGIKIENVGREKFIEICRTALDKYVERMKNILKRFLVSSDLENPYYTDSEEYRALTQKTFIELFKRGLIYEDFRPNTYCPRCKTTIALSEIEREERETKLYYIKFKVKETNEDLIIATTRPELLEACRLIAFNPKDKRYKKLKGKHAIVPIFNLEVPIITRKEIDVNFGSGIMMVCSYGDLDDVKILNEEKIEPKIIIDESGKYLGEKYRGKTLKEVRELIVEELKSQNLIVKEEVITQNLPVHDKCRTPIEIIPMKEYYLKQVEFKDEILKIAKKLKFYPKEHKKRLISWIKSITIDWPISRRRYYATEIPLWYCKNCGNVFYFEDGKYHQPWKEKINVKCNKCGNNEWIGEERTLDTWFDSSITILYLTKYGTPEFEKLFSSIKLRPQGYDIIRTWLYYTLLRVYQLVQKPAFEIVVINGMGLDAQGRKMSKSLGNVIYPEEIFEEIGAEPARFWLAMEINLGNDYRIDKQKILGARAFLTKLINLANFVSQFKYNLEIIDKASDRWIVSLLMKIKKEVINHYKKLEISEATRKIYNFVWDIFASHYVEMVKKRAYRNDESAKYTLHFVFKEILKLLAPIIPATCDIIYRELYGKSILDETFGKINKKLIDENLLAKTEKLLEFNSYIWKKKKELNLSLKDSIEEKVPEELKEFEEDLKEMHNLIY
ncbi:MAG: valine--tRNA ligase [Candidatus Aenigmatarchaeota archaeon]